MEKVVGFPQVYWYGHEYGHNILAMELLGAPLASLFAFCDRKFGKQVEIKVLLNWFFYFLFRRLYRSASRWSTAFVICTDVASFIGTLSRRTSWSESASGRTFAIWLILGWPGAIGISLHVICLCLFYFFVKNLRLEKCLMHTISSKISS